MAFNNRILRPCIRVQSPSHPPPVLKSKIVFHRRNSRSYPPGRWTRKWPSCPIPGSRGCINLPAKGLRHLQEPSPIFPFFHFPSSVQAPRPPFRKLNRLGQLAGASWQPVGVHCEPQPDSMKVTSPCLGGVCAPNSLELSSNWIASTYLARSHRQGRHRSTSG